MLEAIRKAKLSTNATTLLIVIAGFAYLGITFNKDPGSAAVQLLPVLGAMAGAIKVIHQGDATEAKATEAVTKVETIAVKVDESAIVSQENSKALAVIAPQVGQVTEKVDTIETKIDKTSDSVNGAVHSWVEATQRIAAMERTNAALEKRLAVLDALATGQEQGRQQLLDDTAAMAVAVATDPDAPPP